MDTAKILANATDAMTQEAVARCFERNFSPKYMRAALDACVQLDLATMTDGLYSGSENLRLEIRGTSRDQLYVPFQAALKQYPPFLLYVDFASKGYDSIQSAARVRGLLKVDSPLEIIERSLRLWGTYSQLVEFDRRSGQLEIKIKIEKLTPEYIMRLLGAFQADLKASLFLIEMLGSEPYAYFDSVGISIDELASSLIEYESDSKGAGAKATRTLELALWRVCESLKVDTSGANGVIELGDRLSGSDKISTNHNHLLHGLGGVRNMTHHDPDKETSEVWDITKEGALVTTLLVAVVMRSLHRFVFEGKQIF